MKYFLSLALLLTTFLSNGQVKREDGTWYDENLAFQVIEEDVVDKGELLICIYNTENNRCIHNLMTPFEVLVFNEDGEQIWNSTWTGANTDLKFRMPLRGAAYIIVRARNDYVINKLTGDRIFTNGPMELRYDVQ